MKKLGLCLLLMLLLAGCSEGPEPIRRGMELRTRLLRSSSVSFDADITADYGDKTCQFSMACRSDGQGNIAFTVTAPETLSGITGRISEEGGELTFDSVALHFELLTDGQLSPVSAPWIFMKTLRGGYLTSACQQEEGLRLTVDDSYEDDALTADIFLDEQDLPMQAEILYDGRRILTLAVRNMAIL